MVVVDSHSGSESDDTIETSSTSDELEEEPCKNDSDNGDHDDEREAGVSEYEKQRILRIKENKERLQSLGLSILSSSLLSDSKSKKKTQVKPKGKSGKKKNDDVDDEYNPSSDGEARVSSSSSEEAEDEEDLIVKKARPLSTFPRGSSAHKGKHIESSNTKKSSKKLHTSRNKISESDYVDDDEALIQAIALSLEGTSEASDSVFQGPQNAGIDLADADLRKRKGKGRTKENDGRRKKAKTINSRTQMSEDQLIIHFFHFDGAGKGSITKRDLQRVAAAHDFSWTEKEIRDMIHCFDSDGDGKLSLEDFRKIVYQCNMVKIPEKSSMV